MARLIKISLSRVGLLGSRLRQPSRWCRSWMLLRVFSWSSALLLALFVNPYLLAQSSDFGSSSNADLTVDSKADQSASVEALSVVDPASSDLSLVGAITNLTSSGQLEGIVILKDRSGSVLHQDVKKEFVWQGERYRFISIAPNQVKLSSHQKSGGSKELVLTFQGSEGGAESGLVSVDPTTSWSSEAEGEAEAGADIGTAASNWDPRGSSDTANYDQGNDSEFDRPQTYAPIDDDWPAYHKEDANMARDEEYQDLWNDSLSSDGDDLQPYRDVDVSKNNALNRPMQSGQSPTQSYGTSGDRSIRIRIRKVTKTIPS